MERPCPICDVPLLFMERYPWAVCNECAEDTVTRDLQPISFYNESHWGGFLSIVNGSRGTSHDCYIRGIPCYAEEARFGGIVVSRILDGSKQAILEAEAPDPLKDQCAESTRDAEGEGVESVCEGPTDRSEDP